jgi:hypothetical protein
MGSETGDTAAPDGGFEIGASVGPGLGRRGWAGGCGPVRDGVPRHAARMARK